jgi:biopolymer transport protein ExbD
MAEISSGENHKKPIAGVAKSKKASTRVDLTPMVDLGFLLITFFIFTTTMSQPTAMKLVMPDERGTATPTKQGGALTLIPSADGKVYYYEGAFETTNVKTSNTREIRNIIIDKKRRTGAEDLFIVIKPVKTSAYGDLVNVLDEMTINDVRRYAVVDPGSEEEALAK